MATPTHNNVPLTHDPLIDGLLQGSSWLLGPERVLTYSLDLNFIGPSDSWNKSYGNITLDWLNAIHDAFAAWEAVANIHFVLVGPLDGQNQNVSSADISVA